MQVHWPSITAQQSTLVYAACLLFIGGFKVEMNVVGTKARCSERVLRVHVHWMFLPWKVKVTAQQLKVVHEASLKIIGRPAQMRK